MLMLLALSSSKQGTTCMSTLKWGDLMGLVHCCVHFFNDPLPVAEQVKLFQGLQIEWWKIFLTVVSFSLEDLFANHGVPVEVFIDIVSSHAVPPGLCDELNTYMYIMCLHYTMKPVYRPTVSVL